MPKIDIDPLLLSLDTVTTGFDLRHGAKHFFVTFCNEEGENTFYEWDVDPLTRQPIIPKYDIEEIWELIKQCEDEEAHEARRQCLVLQNSKFDVTALSVAGIVNNWPWSRTHDTLIAGHLLASNQPHDLTSMALIYLGVNIKPLEDALKEACREARMIAKKEYPEWRIAKKGLPEMPSAKEDTEKKTKRGTQGSSPWKFDMWLPRRIAQEKNYPNDHPWWRVTQEYSNADSAVTLPLWKVQKELLIKRNLWEIYLERMKVLPVVFDIESKGITISKKRTYELKDKYIEESAQCSKTCVALSGGSVCELSAGVTNELRHTIHNHLGLVSPKKTDNGNPSLDQYVA